mmetsp:Transcript_855/g.2121  ORF Transcript_855/g.2121 Transcript_855/m.2121 type:complete len:98 (+) Transcript_855:203-496(+)
MPDQRGSNPGSARRPGKRSVGQASGTPKDVRVCAESFNPEWFRVSLCRTVRHNVDCKPFAKLSEDQHEDLSKQLRNQNLKLLEEKLKREGSGSGPRS